jgi:filamentous hemagglutinin
MDVHQLAFLSRQPSAAVAPRTHFLGMPKRLLALLLANVMFWQPIWAQADGIAVSGNTQTGIGQAGNGVPVINIAAPNGAGLSHNQFKDYNVGRQGVILNNATNAVQNTQLGGHILGNSQLGGRAAGTILNEVNGGSPSQLNGYTEVAGQSARVIIANPYGVSCNGCGFINTPRVTLSTGKPVLDGSGKLDHFEVDGGSITIDGMGLDAANIDQFDLITRSAKINADIHARQLNVITGANNVNADSLATTPRAARDADKPQLAIDAAALGGMYANTIKLVGTEQGVGVKLAGNMAASAGDIQIDAGGHLSIAQTSAQGALRVNAQSVEMTGKAYAGSVDVRTPGELVNRQSLAARNRIDINADKLSNSGVIAAGIEADNSRNTTGDLSITSPSVTNSGSLEASRSLSIRASKDLTNQGVVQGAAVDLTSARVTNQGAAARIVGDRSLVINTPAIVNLAGVIRFGAGQAASLQLDSLDNREGLIQVLGGSLTITARKLDNRGGQIDAGGLIVDTTTLDNRSGLLSASAGNAQVNTRGRFDNTSGTLQAQNQLSVRGQEVINRSGRLLAVKGDLDLNASSLDNQLGSVLGSKVSIRAPGGQVDNRGGKIVGERIDLNASGLDNRNAGLLAAGAQGMSLIFDPAAIKAQLLNNKGRIQSDGGLLLQGGWLDNSAGTVLGKTIEVDAQRLVNNGGMLLADAGLASLKLGKGSIDNLGGTIQGNTVEVTAGNLDNRRDGTKAGMIASLTGELKLTVDSLINQGGLIESNSWLALQGDTLDNSASGRIRALGNKASTLRASPDDISTVDFNGAVNNRNGTIEVGNTSFSFESRSLDNRGGTLEHANSGLFTLHLDSLAGAGGKITGLGSGDWNFGAVDGLGRAQLNEALTYTSDSLTLRSGDRLASSTALVLNLGSLSNGGELLSDGDLTLNLTGDLFNSGRLSAQKKLGITAHDISQNGGRMGAGTDIRLDLSGTLDNFGYLTARQNLRIDAAQIDNRGTLGAQGKVNLTATGGITNGADALLFSGGDMTLRASSLLNRYGDLYSVGNLSFAGIGDSQAQSLRNLSGTIESEGNISLYAASLENAKAEFELSQERVSGTLSWVCGQHCGGHDSFKRGQITIGQTFIERATKDSASARLVAGKDLNIQASSVQNRYSLLAANNNLTIIADDLLNQGASTRTGQNTIKIGTPGRISTGYWDQMEFVDIPAFNAAVAAGNYDDARFELLKSRSSDSRFREQSNVTVWTDNLQPTYAATIQAGGTVNLNVTRAVQNGTLHQNRLEQLTGTLGDDQTGVGVGGIDINLNPQVSDAGTVTSERIATDSSVQSVFKPVDYSGIPFISVDPTSGPTFQLPNGDYGMFIKNPDPTSRYLIETNPNLTNLSQFFGSDYLLKLLNVNADSTWRRLGDGLYEQRLIRDAVLAKTGQRFLAGGLTSDYEQYRYLMDNALASKDALRLSLGVSLTGEQVSALTHDIVWMENRIVDGQKVLVPVLYLAQTTTRNVRGSSLIQGRDLNLFTGGDLVNVGTLRASNNLNIQSAGSVYQGGLVEAGNDLQMLAQDSIRNAMAGEIRASQVSLVALRGDIINDRTAIRVRDGSGMRTLTDAGSRISARENLAVAAGRDLTNHGALSSGGNATLTAGRDINLAAKTDTSEKHEFSDGGHKSSITTDVKNLAATVTVGGNLTVDAGRDVNVIASQVKAGNNLNIKAGQDFNVTSADDIHNVASKTKDGKKRITEENDRTTQVASVLSAGNNFNAQAARDTNLIASKIIAGNEAYLYSGNKLNLLAAQNSMHTLYDMKEKGNWGAKKAQRDEVTQITHVGTEINTGGRLTLASAGDQRYQVAKLNSGKDLILESGGAITFEGVKDYHDESHTKSKSDLAWTSSKGKGNTDETLRQSTLVAQGALAVRAVDGLKIDIKQINQNTVSQTIDAMVKADPQLAWIKEAEKRGDVDWRQVKEVHDSFKYSHSSLGQGAMLAIIIVVTILTAGAASGLAGAAAGAQAGTASAMAAATTAEAVAAGATYVGAGWGNVIATAAMTSMASTGAVSVINNKGNLGAAVKDTFSSDSLKNAAISGMVAGFTTGVIDPKLGGTTKPYNSITKGFDLSTLEGIGGFAVHAGAQGVTSGVVKTAVNGGSLGDNLVDELVAQAGTVAAAVGFSQVGSFAQKEYLKAAADKDSVGMALWAEGGAGRTALHAMMGGAMSSATGGDFATGAVAAGASQAMAGALNDVFSKQPEYREAAAQIVGLTAAGLAGKDVEKAAWVSLMADQYNRQLHPDEIPLLKKQADSLAKEAKLSPEEAESRLAKALVYYTDKDWNGVLSGQGAAPDALTVKHLGIALAPLGATYAPAAATDVPATGPEKTYTPTETAALIANYSSTHAAQYADNKINAINLQGLFTGDLGYEYANYYHKNLAVGPGLTDWGTVTGSTQGAGKALSEAAGSAWALLSNPAQGSEQIANGLVGLTKHPVDSLMSSVEASQTKMALASLYDMQGNTAASAAIRAQSDVEFALNFLPVNRAKTLAELGAAGKQANGLSITRALAENKGPCCFAAGTKVSTPQGDRTIESIKVGDVVWSKPEKGGKPFAATILATHQRSDQPIYRLKLKNVRGDGTAEGETLMVTPSHPFYVPAKRDFIPVINLKPGDLLQSLADGDTENTSSEVESLELYLPEGKTYNLTVDVGHTFYVGNLKTWVHNTGPCDLPADYFAGGAKEAAGLDKQADTFFGQQRTYWSQEPVQFNGNKVYQRNDLIDPSRVDASTGFTNKQLMENGLAPYGTDGKKVNLHHMLQTQDGPIAEVTQSFHQKNSSVIHINSGSEIPSGINRAQFEKWKKGYWKSRSLDF